jgi:Na+/H+ antiporter NhaC
MVEGMVWFGSASGATGMWFVLITYLAAIILATGLGTSVGTVVALAPVLYPAGIALGADPLALALALIAGGAFGDNLGPISDTTIVSTVSQNAEIGDVVKSRFPLAAVAALIAGIVLLILASMGGAAPAKTSYEIKGNALGLVQLISLVILLVAATRGRHLIESLVYSIAAAAIIGIAIGAIVPSDIAHMPDVRGGETGLIQKGIASTVGPIIFVMLILGITQVMINAGLMDGFVEWARRSVAKSVKQAEASIVLFTLLITIPLAANAPGILIMADYARKIGEQFRLHAARLANLLDCAANTIFYTLPWHNAVIAWYTAVVAAATEYGMPYPPISSCLINPYAWALLAVLLFSIATGWNRSYRGDRITYLSGWTRFG